MPDPLALLEHDAEVPALIEPGEVLAHRADTLPRRAVLCFFAEVLASFTASPPIGQLQAAHGVHPVHRHDDGGEPVAVVHPGVGAPLAVGFFEELVAMGVRTAVACGGCGAVIPDLALGAVVVPDRALRDEGTSFHYQPASRWIEADPLGVRVAREVLASRGVPHRVGATWTTDAIYRETRGRIARRRAEGCLVVEMEASALIAVARFRGVRFAQLLYAGDDVSGSTWDSRAWDRAERRAHLFALAVEVARALDAAG